MYHVEAAAGRGGRQRSAVIQADFSVEKDSAVLQTEQQFLKYCPALEFWKSIKVCTAEVGGRAPGSSAQAPPDRNRRLQEPPRSPVLIRVSPHRDVGGAAVSAPGASPLRGPPPHAGPAGGTSAEIAGSPGRQPPHRGSGAGRGLRFPSPRRLHHQRVVNTLQKREGRRSRGGGTGQSAAWGGARWPAEPRRRVTGRAARRRLAGTRREPPVLTAASRGQGGGSTAPARPPDPALPFSVSALPGAGAPRGDASAPGGRPRRLRRVLEPPEARPRGPRAARPLLRAGRRRPLLARAPSGGAA
ncbi:collagen alpha-1(I) chain-like [Caloenas nicobarica]|uniref:collagen alpha-1(I) chain-like n=1 Tax=Caloenas nicobarica TaxID=187106 RepID=UPI0032B7D510